MSLSSVTAFLLLSGATPPTVDVPAETQTQTERQGNKGAQTPLEPPVVVPTVDDRHSPSPAAPPSSAGEPPIEISSSPDDIVVTARGEPPAGDPLQEANIASYRAVQSIDKAFVAPLATGYQGTVPEPVRDGLGNALRSEEHTSELQSLMRISYAVFCLKKKKTTKHTLHSNYHQI